MIQPKKILVIRNDKLGDFMLAWPAFALLKKQYPHSEITALIPPYTREMAELCPSIDDTLLDEGDSALSLSRKIKQHRFDASIALFTETRTALACFLARLPVRVAPATKLAQIFSNKTLTQRRSRSEKPEYEYNVDLVKHLTCIQGVKPADTPAPPYLAFDDSVVKNIRAQYREDNKLSDETSVIIIHPGTGGSAINFSLQQYATLIKILDQTLNIHIVITAGPGEIETAESLAALIPGIGHTIYHSDNGIVAFSQFIASCDLFISGSTGPLHIAGALNVYTAAFYPARQSATCLRWQTTNQASHRISFSPEKHIDENDMLNIDPVDCAQKIAKFLKTP